MTVRGLRGATTVVQDNEQAVLSATEAFARTIATENNVLPEDIISVLISTTADVKSIFPAKAVRSMMVGNMSRLCVHMKWMCLVPCHFAFEF